MAALHNAINQELIAACHDCSDGGLGVAAAEMAFSGGLGLSIDLAVVPRTDDVDQDDLVLFSESNSRFVVEVRRGCERQFETLLANSRFASVGQITGQSQFRVTGLSGEVVISAEIAHLKEAWQQPLRW